VPRAYIGLGANLDDPAAQVRNALARLAWVRRSKLVAQSSLYRSAPLGPAGQPDYCNAVAAIDTELSPDDVLTELHAIERSMGRERPPVRWAPRRIDLDLLLYEDCVLTTDRLQLPHPEMHKRNFVLVPLAEIAPRAAVPGVGIVADLATGLGQEGLAKWR
jgi:2-amino-4-hydroxy-6-hydroxymethyldihydropteridine diphosphokinase